MNLFVYFSTFVLFVLAFTSTTTVLAVTPVTPENYAFAETQIIMDSYVKKIAKATSSDGVGVFMHLTDALDPDDRTIVRPNFDTLYSFGVFDLTEPLTLVMPETEGRYQSAWLVTEEHYNPYALNESGEHLITEENTGTKYLVIIMRTAVNMEDPADMKIASDLMYQIEAKQTNKGTYPGPADYDMDEILAMREYYQKVNGKKNYASGTLFGQKGDVPLEAHNVGVAEGWGGFTEDQAVYFTYKSIDGTTPGVMTMKNVPIADNSFWSVTIYDENAFATGNPYNINSAFAKENEKGEYVIHFGGDETADNYLEIFDGWQYTLRLYLPTERYFSGDWEVPEPIFSS